MFAGYARIGAREGVTDTMSPLREDATFRQLITADAYPALRAAIDAGVFLDAADPFSFNLDRSLDGLEAYIALGAGAPHEPSRRGRPTRMPSIADDKRFREARRASATRSGRCAMPGGPSGRPRAKPGSAARGGQRLTASVPPVTSVTPVYTRPAAALECAQHACAKGRGNMAELPDVRFLTVAEVAELMRVSKMTVYRLVHSGELPAVRFGRSYRVPESAVTEALQRPIADVG